jgi:diguanylate cyclase (GGDEF)-like protein
MKWPRFPASRSGEPDEATRLRARGFIEKAGRDLSAQVAAVPELVVWMLALLATTLIAAIDYRLGDEISTSIFYVLPVGIASWYADRRAGTVVSFLCAATWLSADLAVGVEYSHPAIAVWNTLVRLGLFLIIANLLVSFHTTQRAAELLAQTDHLTGLGNSRHFMAAVDAEIARIARTGRPFTLVYTDLDNFKFVNDRYGHAAGDQALRIVADTLTSSLRRTDHIARLGGDEFAMLLVETNEDEARIACSHANSRLQAAMEAHRWPIGFSSGAVTFATAPSSGDEAIMIADTLMYHIKAHGKGRVDHCTWPPPSVPDGSTSKPIEHGPGLADGAM